MKKSGTKKISILLSILTLVLIFNCNNPASAVSLNFGGNSNNHGLWGNNNNNSFTAIAAITSGGSAWNCFNNCGSQSSGSIDISTYFNNCNNHCPPPTPVPEPSSMILGLVGLLGSAFGLKKKK